MLTILLTFLTSSGTIVSSTPPLLRLGSIYQQSPLLPGYGKYQQPSLLSGYGNHQQPSLISGYGKYQQPSLLSNYGNYQQLPLISGYSNYQQPPLFSGYNNLVLNNGYGDHRLDYGPSNNILHNTRGYPQSSYVPGSLLYRHSYPSQRSAPGFTPSLQYETRLPYKRVQYFPQYLYYGNIHAAPYPKYQYPLYNLNNFQYLPYFETIGTYSFYDSPNTAGGEIKQNIYVNDSSLSNYTTSNFSVLNNQTITDRMNQSKTLNTSNYSLNIPFDPSPSEYIYDELQRNETPVLLSSYRFKTDLPSPGLPGFYQQMAFGSQNSVVPPLFSTPSSQSQSSYPPSIWPSSSRPYISSYGSGRRPSSSSFSSSTSNFHPESPPNDEYRRKDVWPLQRTLSQYPYGYNFNNFNYRFEPRTIPSTFPNQQFIYPAVPGYDESNQKGFRPGFSTAPNNPGASI